MDKLKLEFINGKQIKGIKYNYDLINKEFNEMMKQCLAPDGLYNPTKLPFNEVVYNVLMSERSSSKTTQLMLYCMCIYKLYGSPYIYARQLTEEITKSMYDELFTVIKNPIYNYIGFITNDEYNDIYIDRHSKKCYFCKNTEDGLKTDDKPFCYIMSIEDSNRYASSFNIYNADHLIIDEFTRGVCRNDYWTNLHQLISTIRRARLSLKIFMLSNTISPMHKILKELCITTQLQKMKKGQHSIITSPLGARVYVELLDVDFHKGTEFIAENLIYHGFPSEELKSLYGGEWDIKAYRRLPQSESRNTEIVNNIVLDNMGNYMRLFTFQDEKQCGVLITGWTNKSNCEIVISDNPQYNTDIYNIRHKELFTRLQLLDNKGLLYFSDNETVLLYYDLLNTIRQKL